MVDYPAAHSMDTEWFAVDSNGHVAAFLTGADGPLPLAAGQSVDDLISLLCRHAIGVTYYLGDVLEDQQLSDGDFARSLTEDRFLVDIGDLQRNTEFGLDSALLWLTDQSARQTLDGVEYLSVPCERGILVYGTFPASVLIDILNRGLLRRGWLNIRLEPDRIGFYVYEYTGMMFPKEPYRRTRAPVRPLHRADVSDVIGSPLEFSVIDFATASELQVVNHVECRDWTIDRLTYGHTSEAWDAGKGEEGE